MPPEVALDILRDIAKMIDDAVVTIYKDNKPVQELKAEEKVRAIHLKKDHRAKRFKFSMVGIRIGEMITFDPTGIQVRVSGDDTSEYEGRIYKLSPFVGTFMPKEKQNNSGAYQGALFFSYNGEKLQDLRRRAEQLSQSDIGTAQVTE